MVNTSKKRENIFAIQKNITDCQKKRRERRLDFVFEREEETSVDADALAADTA